MKRNLKVCDLNISVIDRERLVLVIGKSETYRASEVKDRAQVEYGSGVLEVVSRAGLEPATHWLKASCSTN